MDQQLKFNIIADTIGSDKVNELKQQLGLLGNTANSINGKLANFASGTYILSKAFELGASSIQSFRDVINMGDDLQDLSEITGVSAQKLTAYSAAAKNSGLSTEEFERSLKKMNMSLGDPNNEKFQMAMKALGISVTDSSGKMKSSGDVLDQVTNKFSNMSDGPRKAALAMSIFGKSGSDMIPLLNMGTEAISKLGFKMGDDFPKKASDFNDSIDEMKKHFQESQAVFSSGFLDTFQTAIDSWNAVQRVSTGSTGGIAKDLGSIAKYSTAIAVSLGSGILNLGDVISTVVVDIFSMIKTVVVEIWTTLGAIGRAMKSIVTFDFKNTFSGFGFIGDEAKNNAKERRERYSSLIDRTTERRSQENLYWSLISSEYQDFKPANKKNSSPTPELENKNYSKQMDSLAKYSIAQAEAINQERQRIENLDMSASELKKLTIANEVHAQAMKETVGWEKQSRDAYLATSDVIIKQKQALVDLEQQQKQSYSIGARQAFNEYIDALRDVASQTKQMFTNAFKNMEDSLVSFVKTGKLNFNSLADAIINDLIRIAVKQATLGVLVSMGFSAATPTAQTSSGYNYSSSGQGQLGVNTSLNANGNIVSKAGVMPLAKFATGGVVNSPHVAVFGEAGPEAFVPLPDGRTIPVTLQGQSSSNGVSVIVNVNVESGKESSMGDSEAQSLGKLISAAVKTEIVNQKRPGGLLS